MDLFKNLWRKREGNSKFEPALLRNASKPLPERMRPMNLEEFVGQTTLGEGISLRRLLEAGQVPNCIFVRSTCSGKTTLVRVMAMLRGETEVNAVTTKVAQLRAVDLARNLKTPENQP